MDLTFVQTSNMFGRDGAWETEFSVDQEFNLHLERESSGKIIMMQKTAGTFFDIVKDFDMKSGDVVYDYDSASFLGTKTIKIVSESAIRFASLTTSGEVTEIKSQSKEIEVTSNGTLEVTPDAGFAYLNSVKVKTNVPTSGGGGSTGGGGGEEKLGMMYVTKGDIFTILEVPSDMDIPQDEFISAFTMLESIFPFVANKGVPSSSKAIVDANNFHEDITEGRFTCAAWSASAVDYDRVVYMDGEFIPIWKTIAPAIAEAKVTLSQMFPNQMTEAEFFA